MEVDQMCMCSGKKGGGGESCLEKLQFVVVAYFFFPGDIPADGFRRCLIRIFPMPIKQS